MQTKFACSRGLLHCRGATVYVDAKRTNIGKLAHFKRYIILEKKWNFPIFFQYNIRITDIFLYFCCMIIPRDKYLSELRSVMHNGMIKIITGVRRCGKSYLLFELFKKSLLENGVDEKHIIQIDLENRRNIQLRNPDALLEHIDNRITDDGFYYILLDEIQMVPEFEDVLNSYLKVKNADVYVTGSNSRFLSRDVITEFRGRGYEIRVHPLSFSEFLKTRQNTSELLALQDYMIYGGLPQIATFSNKEEKEKYLKSLFQGTYICDIKERYGIRNDDDLSELIDIIASSIGCLTNPTNLENTFKSVKGHSISDTTIQSYLGMLQDAFLLEKAVRYDIKGKRYINTPSKYYFEDTGLRNARLNYRQIDNGHLMENIIYNELRIRGYSVDVGQVEVRKTNDAGKKIRKLLEVDFICNRGNKRMYIQSVLDMPTQEKIEQETNSLRHIRDGFPKIIITGGLTPSYVNEDGISIINVIDFLKGTEVFSL